MLKTVMILYLATALGPMAAQEHNLGVSTRTESLQSFLLTRAFDRFVVGEARFNAAETRKLKPIDHEIDHDISVRDDSHLMASKGLRFPLHGDTITAVAAILGIGPEAGCVALAYGHDSSDAGVAYGQDLIQFPPPFYGGRISDFADLTGDGFPDIAVRYFGGQSWHMRVYRWDGGISAGWPRS